MNRGDQKVTMIGALALMVGCRPIVPRETGVTWEPAVANPEVQIPRSEPSKEFQRHILELIAQKRWVDLSLLCDDEVVVSMTSQEYVERPQKDWNLGTHYKVTSELIPKRTISMVSPHFLDNLSTIAKDALDRNLYPEPPFCFQSSTSHRELPSIGTGIVGGTASNNAFRIGMRLRRDGCCTTWLITSLELGWH